MIDICCLTTKLQKIIETNADMLKKLHKWAKIWLKDQSFDEDMTIFMVVLVQNWLSSRKKRTWNKGECRFEHPYAYQGMAKADFGLEKNHQYLHFLLNVLKFYIYFRSFAFVT